jgi:uncharacterized membrane protein
MRFSFQTLINFVLLLVFVLSLIVFIFWRFGIFKKEADLGEILDIKAKMDFINSYPYQNLINYFQNLSTTKIEIPEISPEELGRQNLF